MGEVYEGFDEALQRRVAVKAVRREHGWSDDIRARFLREGRVLARLDHPNVCRVFDMVEGDGVDYLILELVEGTTLRQAMSEKLSAERGLEIAEKIAGVLAAAHAAGVVHRDLKPENVMIGAGSDVKVLDFGLARALETSRHAESACSEAMPPAGISGTDATPIDGATTQVGALMGTLQFMSPEQARGLVATPASDMYALGLLLLELATGAPAYPGRLNLSELLQRVQEGTVEIPEKLEPGLRSLLQALLSLRPGDRPTAEATRSELVRLLDLPQRRRRSRQRMALAAAMAAIVAFSALVTYRLTAPAPMFGAGERATVALLPFHNATGSAAYDWVDRGLADVAATNLGRAGGADVIPVGEVVQTLNNLRLSPGELHGEGGARLLAALGAHLAIAAEVRRERGGYVLAYRVVGRDGQRLRSQVTGGDLHHLAEHMASRLAGRLRPTAGPVAAGDAYSADAFANRAHAIGVSTVETEGPRRAQGYFQVALDRDPTFTRARIRLSQCLERLGEWDEAELQARKAAEEARERNDSVLEGQALRILGTVAHARGQWKTAETYLVQSLEAAAAAEDKRLRADTLNDLGRNAMRDSRLDEAEQYHLASIELFTLLEDSRGQALNQSNLGMISWRRGDWEAAQELFERSLGLARGVFDRELEVRSLNNLAAMAFNRRELGTARDFFSEVHAVAGEVGNRDAEIAALNNLAAIHFMLWELDEARDLFERALEIRRHMGDRPRQATLLNNLARVAARRGDRDTAIRDARESLDIREEDGDGRGISISLVTLAEVGRGSFSRADSRTMLERALRLARESGDRQAEADVQIALARVAMDQGRINEARRLLGIARRWRPDYEYVLFEESRLRFETGDVAGALDGLAEMKRVVGEEAWRGAYREAEAVCRKVLETGRREPWPVFV